MSLYLKNCLTLLIGVVSALTLSAQPIIHSFSPSTGPAGTTVTIRGANFNSSADSNIVYFGGARAIVSAATSTTLTVRTPASATYDPISVLNRSTQLLGYSYISFLPTFPGGATNQTVINASAHPPVNFATDQGPSNTIAADIDGDGRPDLVINTSGAVSILRNTSSPGSINSTSFAAYIDFWNGNGTANIVLRDLNGDGKLDLICASGTNTYNARIYINTSTPGYISFGPAQTFPFNSGIIDAADIDGDGKLDLITAAGGGVGVWLNTTPTGGALSFADPVGYGLAGNVSDMTVSDIDGDGKPDIITANGSGNTLTILRNTARPGVINDSSFASYLLVPMRKPAGLLSVRDLDADNKPDIVVTTDSGVAILKNLSVPGTISTASFGAEIDIPTGTDIYGITTGDLDGDGKPEIITANFVGYGKGTVSILKNISTPGSLTTASFAVRTDIYDDPFPVDVAVADLDGDGRPELMVSNLNDGGMTGNYVSVIQPVINTKAPVIGSVSPDSATSGFTVTITGHTLSGASAVSFGGIPAASFTTLSDTVITATLGNGSSGNIGVTTSLGTGTLSGFHFIHAPSITSFTPMAAGRGDTVIISGSSFTDADTVSFGGIAASWFVVVNDNTIKALIGNNGASGDLVIKTTFGGDTVAGFTYKSYPLLTSFSPIFGKAGDTITLNGKYFSAANAVSFGGTGASSFIILSDSVIRAVVGSGSSGNITVITPAGSTALPGFTFIYPAPVLTGFSPATGPAGTKVTITGSGFDPVAANNIVYFGGVRAYVSQGSSTSLTVTAPTAATYQPLSVTCFRKTAYSNTPFLLTFPGGGSITDSSFAAPVNVAPGWALSLADADGDGKLDILSSVNNAVSLTLNTSANGQVSFGTPVSTPNPTGISPMPITTADVDGDGRLDLITGYTDGIPAIAYPNVSTKGTPALLAGVKFYGTALGGGYVATGDFNADGKPDIASAGQYTSLMTVLTNTSLNSNFSFNSATVGPIYQNPSATVVNDFDGDGKPDAIVVGTYYSTLQVFRNTSITNGAISFGPVSNIYNYGTYSMVSGDIDGDGKPDLVVINRFNYLSLYLNTSTPGTISFAAPVTINLTNSPGSLAIGDLDGDGKLDIVTTESAVDSMYIFHNNSSVGALSFAPAITFPTSSNPGMLAIGDVNGDGKPDIVLNANNAMYVYVNQIAAASATTLTSFSPARAGQGATMTIRGTHFTGANSVTFGGAPAAGYTVVSDSVITATLSQGASGVIAVTTPDGTASRDSFTYIYPAPTLTAFTPANADSGTIVTITGANLNGVTSVTFGGTPAAAFYISGPGTISATVGSGASGKLAVFSNTGADSLAGFTFIPPAPVITTFAPFSGSPGTPVTITGTGFTGVTSVSFGGIPATSFTVNSPTSITAVVGNGSSGSITVTNATGAATIGGFNYVAPAPVITSFSPASGPSGTVITITGTNLTGTTAVQFGNVPATYFSVVSADTIRAIVGAGATGWVSVTTGYGTTAQPGFTLTMPVAGLTSFSPASAGTGETVTIMGTHLTNVTGVSFGGIAASSFSVYSDNEITAIVGSGASGNIVVATPNGPDTLTGFVYQGPPPAIQSVYPLKATQGTQVVILGSGFTGTTSVTFGGVPAASFTVTNDGGIVATVGSGASGNIVVTNPSGTASQSGFVFIPPPPQINSFSPQTGTGGTLITIKGAHLTGATSVLIGSWDASYYAQSVTVISDSVVTAVVNNNGASGAVEIFTPGGSASLDGFTFVPAGTVLITGISPASGGAGTIDTITGVNFTNVSSVSFGGVAASSFTVVSPTMITAVVGQGATGAVEVYTSAGAWNTYPGFTFTGTVPPPPVTPHSPVLYSISPANAARGDTVTISGRYLDSVSAVSFGGTPANVFRILTDDSIIAIVGSGSSGNVIVNSPQGADTLSGFTFDTTAVPPVTPPPTAPPPSFQLTQFTGAVLANQSVLQWKVLNDQQIVYYAVEYGVDTLHFYPIIQFVAQGLDSANYTFTDPASRSGVNYYRLSIVRKTGDSSLSNIVALQLAGVPWTLTVYPNPVKSGYFTVNVPSIIGSSQFQVVNMLGQVVQLIPVSAGVQQVQIRATGMLSGVYKIIWSNGNLSTYQTIMVLK